MWLDCAKDERCIVSVLVFRGWFRCRCGFFRLLESVRKHPEWQIRPLDVHVCVRWQGTREDNDNHNVVVFREPGVAQGASIIGADLGLCVMLAWIHVMISWVLDDFLVALSAMKDLI